MFFNEWFGTWFGDWFGQLEEEEFLPSDIVYVKPSLRLAEIHRIANAEIVRDRPSQIDTVRQDIRLDRSKQISQYLATTVRRNRSKSINPSLYR